MSDPGSPPPAASARDPLAGMRRAPGILRLHGHRGARGVLPENTLMGFAFAFDTGMEAVELDVLLTADDIPVVTHNPRLMAASTRLDGEWLTEEGPRICDLTMAELRKFDVGGLRAGTEYADRYPDQAFVDGMCIPTLAELTALVRRPKYAHIWLNIEIKSDPIHPGLTPPPDRLAVAVVDAVAEAGLGNRVIVQSFDWRVLSHVAALAPDLPRSHLTYLNRADPGMDSNIYDGSPWMGGARLADHGGSLPRTVAALGGRVWSPHHTDLDAAEVAEAQALGLVVNTWTANEIADLDRAIGAGVDGIITDYPGRAQRHLLARGLRWR